MAGREKVVVLGEVLIDVFAEPASKPRPGDRRFGLVGVPGGAPCNVAAHLAAANVPVSLVTAFADDAFGPALQSLLLERNIDLSCSVTFSGTRTPLAIVQTDAAGERSFRLYLKGSVLERLAPSAIRDDLFQQAAWFHFGSLLMAYEAPYQTTIHLLEQARRQQVLISCDLNIRPDVWQEAAVSTDVLWNVLSSIDLLKISDEDFEWFRYHVAARHAPALQEPADLLAWGPTLICWTRGPEGATLYSHHARVDVPAPDVDVVDTTGAGDAFTAGLLIALRQRGMTERAALASLNHQALAEAGAFAASQAAGILAQRGAMPAL